MNQYCTYCGTRLNGETYCPKCQRPTEDKSDEGKNQDGGLQHDRPKRKLSTAKTIGFVLSFFAGYALLLGIGAGIYHARNYFRAAPDRAIEKIKHLPDEVVRRMADEEPIYAVEYGWRLLLAVGDGYDDIPLGIYQERMDNAGKTLLGACEELKDEEANSSFQMYARGKLWVWRETVLKHREISRRYWQDEDFRRRVDAFFGGSTFDLE